MSIHICPECGLEHVTEIEEVPAVDIEPITEAAVEVARIEADRDVTLARITSKADAEIQAGWQETRVAELEGRLAGIAETLTTLAPPPPEPVPIVVAEPQPEAEITEPAAAPPPMAEPAPRKSRTGSAWW